MIQVDAMDRRRFSQKLMQRVLICMAVLVILTACEQRGADSPTPNAGTLDLSNWNFVTDGAVPLIGQWRFYPGVLLEKFPEHSEGSVVRVPDVWNHTIVDDKGLGLGTGTYVLDIALPPSVAPMGLSVKTLSSAYELVANGQIVASAGQVGSDAANASPAYRPQVVVLPDANGRLRLMARVANFDHARGGLWDVVWLGHFQALHDNFYLRHNLSMLLGSSALLIGIYHLLIWSLRRSELPTLIFAALCLSLAVRTLCINEIFLLQLLPDISYHALLRMEYFSMASTVLFSLAFVWRIFQQEFTARYMLPLIVPLALYLTVIAVAETTVFTAYLAYFHALVLAYVLIVTFGIIKAIIMRRPGAWLYGLSIGIFCLFILHDLLTTIFRDIPRLEVLGGDEYLLPLGFTVVLLAQAMLLAMRSARANQELERRTAELALVHGELDRHARELEQRVAERTAELEAANTLLDKEARIDGLTQLANRRQFDERLHQNWSDHVRSRKPLSLILIDVDHFKRYNDRYGHVMGDKALRAVAEALKGVSMRPSDLVTRYGGEEMAVLLPNTEYSGARLIAERMRTEVQKLAMPHDKSDIGRLSISLGIGCTVPTTAVEPSELLEAADAALYRAKTAGRDQVA